MYNAQKRTIASEFNVDLYSVPAIVKTNDWQDESWHNDTCPSFFNEKLMLKLWLEADDPKDREFEPGQMSSKKYSLLTVNNDQEHVDLIVETDDLAVLEKAINDYESKK